MIKYFKLIILSFSLFLLNSCIGQDCSRIDKTFGTYQNALKIIKSSDFNLIDDCNTSRSSWIYNAEYFSCDGKTGFLIIETKSRTYIHEKVPIEIWNEFKKAESFGKYYNLNLKSRFGLIL
ncbi:KTSC domain-containing protein [Arenibacter sp. TNZ]|uniref:KTSC domain-containing protein n=1 Tax=Arenibacter TaxID=178469 RepID=UPI000CD4603E|nr:KTSC domain-containing protein [Arenibacter sp. TNZ]